MHNHHADKGGAMEVLAHEAEMLSGAGHQVEQLTLEATERMRISGARAAAKAVWNRDVGVQLDHRITAFRPDVVHVHTPFPLMSPVVFRVAHRRGVPAVTTLHSYRYSCVAGTCWRDGHVCEDCVGARLKLAGVRHRCYHDSLGASGALTAGLVVHRSLGTFHDSVACYLTLTDFSRRLLIRDGFPAERIVVKPNSVPDPGFVPQARTDERRIVFVGRLIEIKGVRALLDAWTLAPPGMRLVIVGDGPLRGLVEQRVSHDASIDYVGWVHETEVTALMGGAEAVVVPSEWYEGLPLVILRSLAVGTPVVVSDMETFSESVAADDVGWSFRVGDVEDLAKRLSALVADPELARSRRPAARGSYMRRYSPTQDLRRLETVYWSVTCT